MLDQLMTLVMKVQFKCVLLAIGIPASMMHMLIRSLNSIILLYKYSYIKNYSVYTLYYD